LGDFQPVEEEEFGAAEVTEDSETHRGDDGNTKDTKIAKDHEDGSTDCTDLHRYFVLFFVFMCA
jgi:hypothetical protein